MSKKTGLSREKRQQINDRVLVLSLFVQILILVNQSIGLYTTTAQTMQASIIEPTGETLQVHIQTDTGRQNLAENLIHRALNWVSSYYVGGIEKSKAQTGLTISVTGLNVDNIATVKYYIEAVPQTSGHPYRFLEGNGSAITVNGSPLNPTNQTTIETHLQAMGLDTTQSHTVDYYVYVYAETTGTVSGSTLASEITYRKFDTITYNYGVQVTEEVYPDMEGFIYATPTGITGTIWLNDANHAGMHFNVKYRLINKYSIPEAIITDAKLHFYEYIYAPSGQITWYLYSCQPFHMVDPYNYNYTGWNNQPANLSHLATLSLASNGVGWRMWRSQELTDYVADRAGSAAYFKLMIPDENFETEHKYGGFESTRSLRGDTPHLEVTYLSYMTSWYRLPALSLTSLPVTLDMVALTLLIIATGLALIKNRRKRDEAD